MTPLRQRESLMSEIAGLRQLLQTTGEDPLASPLMRSRLEDLEARFNKLQTQPSLTPEAEMFFTDGPAVGSEAIEVTFASEVLNSYQNMVTNHFAATHYGGVKRTGRRRGEEEARLYLTALPRGSFGMQLSQPYVSDFYAAENVSKAMLEISGLIRDTAASDDAFEEVLSKFDARVFRPLKRFIIVIHAGGGACRIVTGNLEVSLTPEALSAAYMRISAAVADDLVIEMSGVFGGAQVFSCSFEFQPDAGDLIRGDLDPELSEEVATKMNQVFTKQRVMAKMKMTTVSTRTGKKKPTYELMALRELVDAARPLPPDIISKPPPSGESPDTKT